MDGKNHRGPGRKPTSSVNLQSGEQTCTELFKKTQRLTHGAWRKKGTSEQKKEEVGQKNDSLKKRGDHSGRSENQGSKRRKKERKAKKRQA